MAKKSDILHLGLVGAGGHGREMMPIMQAYAAKISKKYSKTEVFYIEKKDAVPLGGIPVLSEENFLSLGGTKFFNVAIANSKIRQTIAERFEAQGATPVTLMADNFVQLGTNSIGRGGMFSPFSCVTADVSIGDYFQCNIYSSISHDCAIGDYVTFAPGVRCNGNIIIESHAYIGAGAIIKQGTPGNPLVIGRGAIVGMGAVVTKSVAPDSVVIGNPAKLMHR